MASVKTKKPALGAIPKDAPKGVKTFLKSIKELLEVGEGRRGDSLDRYLTYRNLVDSGLAKQLSDGSLVAQAVNPNFTDVTQFPGYTTEVPEAPTNVTVTGGFSYIFVKWDVPTDPKNIILHAEVWRSETDDLGTATLAGTSPSSFYLNEVGTGSVTYYYWVRFVSRWSTESNEIVGPYNAVAGTPGETSVDPAYVLEVLEGQISATQLNTDMNTLIDKIEPNELAISTETQTRSFETGQLYSSWTMKIAYDGATPYVAGIGAAVDVINGNPTSNVIISADSFAVRKPGTNDFFLTADTVNGVQTVGIGSAHIHDLAVTNAAIQSLAADKIFAQSGTLAQAFIGTGQIENAMIGNVIQSDNYVPNSSGWSINKSGFAEFQNAKVTGNITADSINANAVDIIDTLMLREQAVTFPVSYWNPNRTDIVYYDADLPYNQRIPGTQRYVQTTPWRTVASLSFTSSGAPKFISGFFRFAMQPFYQVGYTSATARSSLLYTHRIVYRILRNGAEYLSPVDIWYGTRKQYEFDYENEYMLFPILDKNLSFSDISTGTGVYTYTLQIRFEVESNYWASHMRLGSESLIISFWEKSLLSIETKR